MAPKKRRATEGGDDAVTVSVASTRVTRSSTGRDNPSSLAPSTVELPPKGKKQKKSNNNAATNEEVKPLGVKKNGSAEEPDDVEAPPSKTIVIEHCKQCNSFKTRALQVKNGLENGVSGITVLVNPHKPRRGCFEIWEEGGEKFISLLDMKRPFAKMKALDMGEVISDIIGKVK